MDHRCCGRDGLQFETGSFEERAEFGFGAFLAAGEGEHDHVHVFRGAPCVAGGNHAIGDQQLAICGNHFAAMAEDPGALFVCPIVNDVAEEVGVGASRDAFEEAAFDDGAAIGQARGLQVFL